MTMEMAVARSSQVERLLREEVFVPAGGITLWRENIVRDAGERVQNDDGERRQHVEHAQDCKDAEQQIAIVRHAVIGHD
jgi:hypothetical protein